MQKVFKNTFLYTIGRILPQAVNFFLLPVYTAYLNPTEYGIVSSLRSFTLILSVIFTLALSNSIFRLFFDYKTEKEQKEYLGTTVISIFVLSTFFLILLFIFYPIVGKIYKSISFFPYYALFISATFLAVFFEVPKIYFQVKQKGAAFLGVSLFEFFITTALTLWYVVGLEQEALGVLKSGVYANILILPLFLYITFKKIKLTFSFKILKESLRFSLPTVPVTVSYWILNLSDRIFIERYFDLNEVGIYSIANKIAEVSVVLIGALSSAYSPVFYTLANSENQSGVKSKIRQFNYSYIIISGFIVFGIAFFSGEITSFFIDSKYANASKIIPVLSLAYFFSIVSGLYNWMIIQEKKTFQMMIIVMIIAGFNIIVNILLIKQYGMYGAAWATVLSFLLSLIIKYFYAQKCYFISLNWFKISAYAVILIIIYFFTGYFFKPGYFLIVGKIIFMISLSYFLYKKYFRNFYNAIKTQKN